MHIQSWPSFERINMTKLFSHRGTAYEQQLLARTIAAFVKYEISDTCMRNIKGFLRHFYFWSWYLLENGLENGEGGGRKQWDIEKRDANNNYFIFNFWFFQRKGNPKSWSLSLEVVDKDCIFCLAEVESALKPYQHATWSVCVCLFMGTCF